MTEEMKNTNMETETVKGNETKEKLLVSWGMANQIAINTSIVGKSKGTDGKSTVEMAAEKEVTIRSFHNLTPELKNLLLSFCNLSLQFHQRLTSVIPYPGNRELRSVCADYCYDMRSLLMDTSESLSSQRSVAYSLQICCKYIDFYRIHYVLHYPTEYLYQYYVASFIQDYLIPNPDPSEYHHIVASPTDVAVTSIVVYLKELVLYGNMQLLSHFIASVAAADVSIDGLAELRAIVDACPFREHREIPSITLEQLISWRQLCKEQVGKLREANSPMSAIVAPFVGELPRSTWERELLWDILYRKDVLPRAAVESAIDSGDESLFICMKSCFEVLSRVIEQGLSFVSLAVVEVMTLLGNIETAPRGVDVLHALFLDFVGDCLQNRVDVTVPLNVTLIMCGRLSQGLLGEVVQFLVDAEPVEDDQDVETLLQLLACVTDVSLQQTLTEQILHRYQSHLLIDGALEAAAKWERELILRCGLAEVRSEAIERVLLRIRSSPSDFIRRGMQIRYLLEDVKESVSNYEVLECLLRIAAKEGDADKSMARLLLLLNTVSDEQRIALVTVLAEFLCNMEDIVSFVQSISLDNLLMLQSELMILRYPPRAPSLDLTEEMLIKYEDILSGIIQAKSTLV